MGNEINSAVWGLLGTLVGAAASVGTAWIANAHAAKLESQKGRDTRAETARAFQRQTLLELQDALNVMADRAFDAYAHDLAQFREGKEWGTTPNPEGLASFTAAVRTVGTLTQRVASLELRHEVGILTETTLKAVNADTYDRATALRSSLTNDFPELSMNLGDCLRSHYEAI